MKKLITLAIAVGSVLALNFLSASTAGRQDPRVPERFASFEMSWDTSTTAAINSRAQAVVEIMSGQQLKRPASLAPIKDIDGVTRRLVASLPDAPRYEVQFLREYNELRVVDSELAVATRPRSEISRDTALEIARKTFGEMAARKVINAQHFDWNRVDTATTLVGEGTPDGKNNEKRRIEYRFTLRRVLNGIEVANSGLRIAVHATGRVSSVRVGGVMIASRPVVGGQEEPVGTGRWLERRPTADPENRLNRELVPRQAKAKVVWSQVMYVMPEGKRTAVVEPLQVISYSLEFPQSDGPPMISRRKTVGFSLTNPSAPPIDLTPPARTPQTELTKKRY